MRFIFGIIVGALLAVGVAYVVDSSQGAPTNDGRSGRQLVNWDVVDADLRGLSAGAQDLWAKLVGGARKLDKEVDKPAS